MTQQQAAIAVATPVRHTTPKPVQSVAAVSKAQTTTPTSSVVNRHVPTPVAAKPRVTLPATTQQILISNQHTLAQLTPQQQRQFFAQHPKLHQQLFPKAQLTASKSKFLRKSPKKKSYCLLFSRESRTTSSLLETIQKRRKTFPCIRGLNE